MLEEYKMTGRKLYIIFVDSKKAPDCVSISRALKRKGVIARQIFAITKLYKNIETSVKIEGNKNNLK